MTKNELKSRVKVWCWWKSRYLYYTGFEFTHKPSGVHYYRFRDICGAITDVTDSDLGSLEIVEE